LVGVPTPITFESICSRNRGSVFATVKVAAAVPLERFGETDRMRQLGGQVARESGNTGTIVSLTLPSREALARSTRVRGTLRDKESLL